MHYEHLYEKGVESPEYKACERVRHISLSEPETTSGHKTFISEGYAFTEYEREGEIEELYPLDTELNQAIAYLESITAKIENAECGIAQQISQKPKGRKHIEEDHQLLRKLGGIYEKYTGKPAKGYSTGSEASNPQQVYSKVIRFLKHILPYTNYSGEIEDEALVQALKRAKR